MSMEQFQPGAGTSLQHAVYGPSISTPARAGEWRHPWYVDVGWQAGKQWVATVKAGFVGDRCPIFRTTLKEQQAAGNEFGINPLTGQPFFSSFVFDHATPADTSETVEIPLYLRPAIPLLSWRDAGRGGGAASPLDEPTEDVPESAVRLLRATDVILHQPRLALTSEISSEPGLETGASFDRQVLSTAVPLGNDKLRVYAGQMQLPTALDEIDPLSGVYEEQPWDELKIATVYMLSAPGAPEASEPDGSWLPIVKYDRLFWNVKWLPAPALRVADVSDTPSGLSFLGGLGNALILPIANTIGALSNDAAQQALNNIQAHSQAGTFFTPTGGGSLVADEVVAATIATRQSLNAGRPAALQLAAANAARDRARARINPVFPYRALPLDPARLDA